ncbi:MAG: hypothetical protein A3G18_03295 [Rhodospirillales bacterium RIFCSPLOWO2_12_FULL_58_28]|nr:MAG: hypothetical protein A3H92_03240 [Rhodospirillales bacterium RIFCSPLOWO2_02_FULL_58_16]OHC77302.1 MAG: hypothetical protein A3G18_03295 [Rhodospirillales bacterium RIFCSPLOWO2_12_FULL_58_28]
MAGVLIDFRTVQLLCSRLCHDLIGPAGAVNAGLEVLEDAADDDGEAAALVADSARQLSGRLAFFRMAFGQGAGAVASLVQTRSLAAGLIDGNRVTMDWPEDTYAAGNLPRGGAALILNLILLSMDSLPRGGELSVRPADLSEGMGIAVTAKGPGARLRDDIRAAMAADVSSGDLTAHNVHGYFTMRLAESLNTDIEISDDMKNEVRMAALMSVGK